METVIERHGLHVDYIVVDTVRVKRETFGAIIAAWRDGYTEALRAAYPDVPDSADYVMFWWWRAAEEVRAAEEGRRATGRRRRSQRDAAARDG